MAAAEPKKLVWVHRLCDSMFEKVRLWDRSWLAGDVAATRSFMTKNGRLEDVVTRRKVDIAWHPREMEMLVGILRQEKPLWQLTLDLDQFFRHGFWNSRMLPGGLRVVGMVSYEFEVKELLKTLAEFRESCGKRAPSLEKDIASGNFWDSAK